MNFYIQWDFTNLCNLKCKHCYKNSDENNNELNLEDCLKICDIINLMAIENKLKISLSLTGGEPFTRKKDLYEILDYIENKTVIPIGTEARIDTEKQIKIELLEKCVK